MRLTVYDNPQYLFDFSVERTIIEDISYALHSISTGVSIDGRSELVVNPTVWHRLQNGKMSPLAANQAGFFSGSFQRALEATGRWEREKEIEGQTIDAYAEFMCAGGASISIRELCEWLPSCGATEEQLPAIFANLHGSFVQRSIFTNHGLPNNLKEVAKLHLDQGTVRVGVEFETGNIASSFRALMKLSLLFRLGKIDMGVFITSSSKSDAAAVIWPASNRNGSFEELNQRRWKEMIDFPLLGIGFAPDRLDKNARVLRANGVHASVVPTGRIVSIGNRTFAEWRCDGELVSWYASL